MAIHQFVRGKSPLLNLIAAPLWGRLQSRSSRAHESLPGSLSQLPRAAVVLAFALFAIPANAQLPDGPGKAETERICSQCHELERSISLRQDHQGWQATTDKMVTMGAKGTDKEFQLVVDYLAANFAGEAAAKINVNKAEAIELESALSLKRSESRAIIQYREKNGNFKSIDDLKKVPGIDVAKIEAKKDRLSFK